MFPGELEARKEIVRYSHKVHAAGLVSATDGNLSIRLDEHHVLITPSSLRKEDMYIEAPIVIDMQGNPVSDTRRPSTEYKVHLEVYQQRPDVRAVIHAHPPKAIAFTIAEAPLDTCILPEVVVTMGEVPVAPYAAPSTEALPQSMRDLIRHSDALMLARHGSVTVGSDLGDAFKKLEKLEHNAEILIYARILGGARSFSGEQLEELQGLRDFYGIKTTAVACNRPAPASAARVPTAAKAPAVAPLAYGAPQAPAAPLAPAAPQAPAAAPRWTPDDGGEEQAPTWRGGAGSPSAGSIPVATDEMDALVEEIVARVKRRL
jgi:L-fuculose-phosphate aldolase